MLKLACGLVALLSLLAAAALLWAAPGIGGDMPHGLAGWAAAGFAAFKVPATAILLLVFCAALVAAAMSVTELLLGIAFSVLAALVSFACLFGVLGSRYPGFEEWVIKILG
jgi:hypothetical protein